MQQSIILASSSSARQAILSSAGLNFSVHPANIDEHSFPNESAKELVQRLAQAKAKTVAARFPQQWIIGADQVLFFDGAIYGKPHTEARAKTWLKQFSGQMIQLNCGLCLHHQQYGVFYQYVKTELRLHVLNQQIINQYCCNPQIWGCAGGLMLERYGAWLIAHSNGGALGALEGMPLLALHELMQQANLNIVDYWLDPLANCQNDRPITK